jgi:hypothetical protein
MNESMSRDHASYANLNHVCTLLQFYMSRESEITTYYFLSSNLQHRFIEYLHYEQVWQFLV